MTPKSTSCVAFFLLKKSLCCIWHYWILFSRKSFLFYYLWYYFPTCWKTVQDCYLRECLWGLTLFLLAWRIYFDSWCYTGVPRTRKMKDEVNSFAWFPKDVESPAQILNPRASVCHPNIWGLRTILLRKTLFSFILLYSLIQSFSFEWERSQGNHIKTHCLIWKVGLICI